VRRLVTLLGVILAAVPAACGVAAQQVPGLPLVGLLTLSSQQNFRGKAAFLEGMRSLNWIEGRNFAIEERIANGDPVRLSANAADLAAAKVAVIVAFGAPATQAARHVTSSIPIVGAAVGEPSGSGFIAGLARPGGNVTGLTLMTQDVIGKQLELLKDAVPRASKIGVLLQPDSKLHAQLMKEVEQAATALGISALPVAVGTDRELPRVFDVMTAAGADAYFVLADPRTDALRNEIVTLALRDRLPGAAQLRLYTDAGVLMSYAASLPALQRRAAVFVDKILKGENPADLPVEQPTTFELVVNLKTAEALGLTIPYQVLARADEVIE
jgi:putative ABC transport system substrate-binding protein